MAARVPPAWVIRPLLAMRNGVARLHRAMVPPEVPLLERSMGIVDTKAVAVAAELGIADALDDGPRAAADLADETSSDPDALARLLRYLVGRGVFRTTRDGRFRNNRASELLRDDHPGSMRAWMRFYGADWHVASWNRLGHSVRTGEAAADVALGHPFWEYLTEVDPEAGALFDAAMASTSSLQMDVIARKYHFTGRVCDVGGGTGSLLAAVLLANPGVRGVLFDLPAVVAKAPDVLDAAGVSDRVEVIGGASSRPCPRAVTATCSRRSCTTGMTSRACACSPGAGRRWRRMDGSWCSSRSCPSTTATTSRRPSTSRCSSTPVRVGNVRGPSSTRCSRGRGSGSGRSSRSPCPSSSSSNPSPPEDPKIPRDLIGAGRVPGVRYSAP